MEPHAPLPSSSFVAEFLLHGFSSERKCLFSSAYLPFLASPSESPDTGSSRDPTSTPDAGKVVQTLPTALSFEIDGPQVRKITSGLRHQCCAAAANSCRRLSFSGRMNRRNIPTHPQEVSPSLGSLGLALVQCTALDWQKTRL